MTRSHVDGAAPVGPRLARPATTRAAAPAAAWGSPLAGKEEGRGKGKGKDAANKVAELQRKVDELIGKGKIRPPATTRIQQAVAQLALARLERLRAEHLALLAGLDGGSWERTGRHGEHGVMTLELYETHVAAEEVDHPAQIARLR